MKNKFRIKRFFLETHCQKQRRNHDISKSHELNKNVKILARSLRLTGEDFEYIITNDPNTAIELTISATSPMFAQFHPQSNKEPQLQIKEDKEDAQLLLHFIPLSPISTRNAVPVFFTFFFSKMAANLQNGFIFFAFSCLLYDLGFVKSV